MSRQRVVLLFAVAAGVALSALPSVFAAEFRVVKPDEIKYLRTNPAAAAPTSP